MNMHLSAGLRVWSGVMAEGVASQSSVHMSCGNSGCVEKTLVGD